MEGFFENEIDFEKMTNFNWFKVIIYPIIMKYYLSITVISLAILSYILFSKTTDPNSIYSQEWQQSIINSIRVKGKKTLIFFHKINAPEVSLGYDFNQIFESDKVKLLKVGDVIDKNKNSDQMMVYRKGKKIGVFEFLKED